MENRNYDYDRVIQLDDERSASRRFIANVFSWMFLALGISAFFAYIFSHDASLLQLLVSPTGLTAFGKIVMFAPLAFVLVMSFGMNRISFPVLSLLFIVFAAVMGISLSFILLAFTASSVLGVFITTSAVFGIMAVAGYTTSQDLTKFGSLMMMGLIGIIIASVVNMWLASPGISQAITYIGVAVFVGLTAYKVQMLKRIGAGLEYGDASAKKLAVMGGMSLYLTFINLFLSLLRIFGGRRN
ncbi:Bax inhibitor-1/YccA family protein [Mucilaginibacter sp. Bleaf8]|uniref:Bax inhibitor-1/YccA family protein n=1 Tax=Mucilaginibacter sp. Bleaf8 TaxID=2834430 RepID=UPI001BD07672|nr:Bax inhibitor-1/YccA family protein [Mucilaginibacter sp. Bleaf8]MBS7566553.1 Bax inhibitor-1/YccA family protein [Mucilaginibacter sp. Bleaf8]